MISVEQYSILALQDGVVSPDRLETEVRSHVGLETLSSITQSGTSIYFTFLNAITQEARELLNSVVAEHRDDLHHLPTVKQMKFRAIDAVTVANIEGGFEFRGIRFELYLEAQVRLLAMIVMSQHLTYPILYNSKDDMHVLELNNAGDVAQMSGTALAAISTFLNSGTALKQMVREATTVEEVNAIIDTRPVP